MTTHQVILLLDIARGFDSRHHTYNMSRDITRFVKSDFVIKTLNGFELTKKGHALVNALIAVSSLMDY